MQPLTPRQTEILEVIRQTLATRGMPPTIAEIAAAIGVSSTHGIRGHLQALERKGAIALVAGVSRGIRLLSESPPAGEGLAIVGRVAAGRPILAAENVEDHCPVDGTLFRPRADYLLRVQGLSMRDAGILDGDLLAVHRQRSAENGQIVVARIADEVTVKRLRHQGQWVHLEAENPDFPPIEIDLEREMVEIEGIAVGVLRHL
jgi:repressor LexA